MARSTLQLLLIVASCWACCGVLQVEAKHPNRAIENYATSGDFFPKVLIPNAIRRQPDIFWPCYASLCVAIIICWVICFQSIATYKLAEKEKRLHQEKLLEILRALQNYFITGGLISLTINIQHLSEAVEANLAIMCAIQIVLDSSQVRRRVTTRMDIAPHFIQVFSFMLISTIGITYLDSYRPLNILNLVYYLSTGNMMFLATSKLKASFDIRRDAACIVSTVQFCFVLGALLVAQDLEGVHQKRCILLVGTVGANYAIVTMFHCLCFCNPAELDEIESDQNPVL